MATATQCVFPSGCKLRTKDGSGLCHNHRRFSALTWDAQGKMTQPRRLSTTLSLMKTNPEFMEVYKAAGVAMDNQVGVIELGPGRYQFWNTAGYSELDGVGETKWERDPASGALIANMGEPENEHVAQTQRRAAYAIRERIRAGEYADKYGIYTHVSEEYDDEAEVIAQLNIGRRFGNSGVSLMSGTDHPEYDLRVRVTTPGAAPSDNLQVDYRFEVDHAGDPSVLYRSPVIVNTVGNVSANNNQDVTMAVTSVLGTIDILGVRDQSTGRIYMPMGWSDR